MYFLIHDVSLKVVGASPPFRRFLDGEIGSFKLAKPVNDPDIALFFLDKIAYKKKESAGDFFLSNGLFFFIDSNGKKAGFSPDLDKKTKVLCENGFSFRELLGHLEEILKYKLLKKGIAPIHGSSFVYRDRGVNICAWINGGKTNSLLYFLERGASYISDEFTVLSKRGDLLAYPKRIDLRDFNVMALPTVAGNLSLGQRIRFRIVLTGKKFFRIFYLFGLDSISKIGKNIEFKVRMPLKKLFPGLKIVKKQRVDTLFLLLESNSVRAKIRPLPLDDFIDRVMATNIFEASKMVNDCRAYSFITGNRLSFARLHEKEREILSIALRPVKIYEVLVPKNFKDAMQEIEKLI